MKYKTLRLNLSKKSLLISTAFFSAFLLYEKAFTQTIPDNTLGTESSTVRSIDKSRDAIEGGAIRGKNLFHSFSEFNVGEDMRVNFTNPQGISKLVAVSHTPIILTRLPLFLF